MKLKQITLFVFVLLASLFSFGQSDCRTGSVPNSYGTTTVLNYCTNAQSTTASGTVLQIKNQLHGTTTSFEYIITGTPVSISVVLQGCMTGGTCDALETYTTVANSIRNPTQTKVYDYFLVTPTWSGGTSPSFSVNTSITTAKLGSASQGNGTGTLTNVATSAPLSGGPITNTGTIGCPTCTTAVSPGTGIAHFPGGSQAQTSSPVVAADTDTSIAHTGVDINTIFQVTALHLPSSITVSQGGTGAATLTGLLKGNGTSPVTAAASSDVIALWTGTCSLTTFLRGDGSCQTPPGTGTVTTVGDLAPLFTVTNRTTTPAYSLTAAAANLVFGNCTGSSATPAYCALTAAMIPTLNQSTTGLSAGFTGSLSGDVTGTQGATVVAKINGNSVPSGAAVHQVLDCTGANTCVWKTVPDCNGASNALNYTQSTDLFSCLSITTLSNPMTTLGDFIVGGTSGAVTRLAGATTPNGVPQYLSSTPSGGVATAPALSLPGLTGRAITLTTATDTIVSTDCNPNRVEYVGSVAVATALPTAPTLGVPKCVFKLVNATTGSSTAVTITPTTWTINGNSTLVLAQGQQAWIYVDPNSATNWQADVNEGPVVAGTNITLARSAQSGVTINASGGGSGTVNSGTSGDLAGYSSTGTAVSDSGIITANVPTAASNYVSGNLVQGAGANKTTSDSGIATSNVVRKDAANTGAAAMTLDMSASTVANAVKVPVGAGLTAGANGVLAYDSTVGNTHARTNAADSLVAAEAAALTANTIPKAIDSTHSLLGASSITDDGTKVATPETLALGTSPPTCAAGTSGADCSKEGTAPTAVASIDDWWADSTSHTWMAHSNGGSAEMFVMSLPGPINQTAKTAVITTATLCAASAGACNQAGQYHIHWDFWGSGTACTVVTVGSVGLNFTWTDENAVTHTTVSAPMWDQKSAALGILFNFNTALGTEGASGDFNISTNGTVIQYATTYTACSTGTGTYNLRAAVTRLQ